MSISTYSNCWYSNRCPKEFKAEQPKYAAECLNYQKLWKTVTETFRDEEVGAGSRSSKVTSINSESRVNLIHAVRYRHNL